MRLKFQITICWLAGLCWLALPASAQVQVGGLNATLEGNLGLGYSASANDPGQSAHGTNVTGTGYFNGYYYDPKFLTFHVQPSYGHTQENTDSQSIFDTANVSATAAMLSGGYFPGSVVFGKTYNSAGQFGISNAAGLLTKSNSQTVAINWSERLPGLPVISLGFTDNSGDSSLLGTSEESHSTNRTYLLRVNYKLLGFSLDGDATRQHMKVDSVLLADSKEASDSNLTSYGITVAHKLPLSGYFSARYGRSNYSNTDSSSSEGKYFGTTNNVSSTMGFNLKAPVTITTNYTDDVFGSIEQYLLSQGNSVLLSSVMPKSSQLALSASSQYVLPRGINISGYFSYTEQNFGDTSYSTTQGGGTLGYSFAHFLKGLIMSAGVVDTGNQDGNQRAALIGSVSYGHSLGHWGFGTSFSYDQSTNTLGIVYTASTLNYSANIRRRFSDNLKWSLAFSGNHTGFEQQTGNSAHSQSYYTSVTWFRFSASSFYSQSYGSSILTQTGIVTQPLPTQLFGSLTSFSARGMGGGIGLSPLRKLNISSSYSRSNSYTQNSAVTSKNLSDQLNSRLTYQFRKIYFNAGYARVRQLVSASNSGPTATRTYYFGVSRWFDFF